MEEEKLIELSRKCTDIRDKILDNEFTEEVDIKKEVRKLLNKKEMEELAVQFIIKEALTLALEEREERKKKESCMYG